MPTPPNAPLYQTDQSLRSYDTEVKNVRRLSQLDEADRSLFSKAENATHVIETTQTIFHPQGGGQPSDTGIMRGHGAGATDEFAMELARNSATVPGSIMHAGHFRSDAAEAQLPAGHSVHQEIDSAARDLHSRIHTAGHLIGFAVHALRDQIGAVGEGKASHFPGSSLVEFIGAIAGEHKAAIQHRVDEYVEADLPVEVDFLSEEEAIKACTAVPDVIKADQDGAVRVVAVKGLGAYPCGGTHLPSTRLVGKIEVRNIRRKSGITKISYDVSR